MDKEKYTFKNFLKDLKEVVYNVSTDIISKVIVLTVYHAIDPPSYSCPNFKCCQCPYNCIDCRYKNY